MDYNQLPLSLGFLGMENQIEMDRFSNLSDDEKKEYIERNRSRLSDDVVDRLTSSIAEDDDII
ncbi:MAG: hypothetical protein HDR03_05600 [Lachnospiraceae bacterium]|nr:hypothetical protein [Lachnospiraceae bacterium]